MTRTPLSDIVVLLPGILGSELEKNGKPVWSLSAGSILRALRSAGGSITDLELKDDADEEFDAGDGVRARRVMPDTHLLPGFWKIDGYTKIAQAIRASFEVRPGENFFEFPYDWRRSNRVAAKRLKEESAAWLKRKPGAKLILIGHSMGGLVARYFLEVLDGWSVTRSLITFGTPHRGSLNALNFVVNGYAARMLGVEVSDLSALLRSFPSVYELLPIYPCCDLGTRPLARVAEAKLPHVDPGRLERASDFHAAIRKSVEARGKAFDTRVHPVVGTHQPTLQSARFRDGVLEMLQSYDGEDSGGDGTVPRVSATPIELSDEGRDVFAAERHASLQNNDAVLTQVDGILRTGRLKLSAFQKPAVNLSVSLEDAYAAGEPVPIAACPDSAVPELQAQIAQVEDGAVSRALVLRPGEDGWHRARTEPLPPGTYRVTVFGDTRVRPVTDVFLVA